MSKSEIDAIAAKHGIRLALQFGSSATGREHAASDVDLAVLLDEPPRSLEQHGELLHDLQQLYPARTLDLSILNHADPLFLKKVLERCILVHGTTRLLQELKIYSFKRYQDHRRYFELERHYVTRILDRFVSA